MARQFDGDGYITFPAIPNFDLDGHAYTVMAWLKLASVDTSSTVIGKGSHVNYRANYDLAVSNAGYLPAYDRLRTFFSNGSIGQAANGDSGVSLGDWHLVIGWYDGAAGSNQLRVYLDNTQNGAWNNVTDALTTNIHPLVIGASGNGGEDRLIGTAAEVAVWGAALTSDERNALWSKNSPALVRSDDLIFYAPLLGEESPEPDWATGATGVLTNAEAAEHVPGITYPPPPAPPPSSRITAASAIARLVTTTSMRIAVTVSESRDA